MSTPLAPSSLSPLAPLSKSDRAAVSAAWISLGISLVVLSLKFMAYQLTKSTAVFSDAVESIVNVVAAVIALFVMRVVARPADEEHPYGHGKLEYFSAAFEGGLVAFAAIAIGIEAVRAILHEKTLSQPDVGIFVMAGAAVINLLLGLYLRSAGKKYRSQALLASSVHVISDVWTTVGVLFGLALVFATGAYWIDPIIALGVALHLVYSGYKIVRENIGGLMDEVEPESLKNLAHAFQQNRQSWVIDIHQLRVIRSGKFHHIDAHLVVPEFWNVLKTHDSMVEFERQVVETYHFDGEIAFHIDPCERKYCDFCEMEACPVRAKEMVSFRKMTAETLVRGPHK